MAQPSTIPQDLMSGSLLHFQQGVPIDDLNLRTENRKRLARVEHVYWQWIRNPFTVDYKALLRQLVRGHYADAPSECHAAQKDVALFEFVKENVTPMSRREAEIKAKVAIDKMLSIGMETDNVNALDKGTKHIITLAGLDKPESEQIDMAKANFIQPVVTTIASEVDPSKIDYSDEQSLKIMQEFGAYIDPKRQLIDNKVTTMEAKAEAETDQTNEP